MIDLVRGRGFEVLAAGQQGASSGEVGGKEAERLVLVGGQWRAVALEGARDAAAGGARAVAEGLDAALPLQLCRGEGETKKGREGEERDLKSDVSMTTERITQQLGANPPSGQFEPKR